MTSDVKRLFPQLAPMISIYLIDAAPGILGSFDAKLAQYAAKKFQRDGIRVLNNRTVKAVERGRLIVEPDGEIAFGLVSLIEVNSSSSSSIDVRLSQNSSSFPCFFFLFFPKMFSSSGQQESVHHH